MSDATNQPFNYDDPKQLTAFLNASAGIVRDVLSVVEKQAPDLIDSEVREKWFKGSKQPSKAQPRLLLTNATRNAKAFFKRFAGYFDSIPDGISTDNANLGGSVERLQQLMLDFVTADGLKAAAEDLRQGRQTSWDAVVNFTCLPEIRSLLDKLRHLQVEQSSPKATLLWERIRFVLPGSIGFEEGQVFPARPKIYRLLKYLSRNGGRCTVDTLEEGIVWPINDRQSHNDSNGRIDSLLTGTRRFLKAHGFPFTVSRHGDSIQLKEAEVSQPNAKMKPPKRHT